jgi:O-antigen/teichoic acid export membrane protein
MVDPVRERGMETRVRPHESVTVQMGLLFAARAGAFAMAFAVPLVLVRAFSPWEYGLYKQFLLLHASLGPMLALGIAASLYYFVPAHPEEREAYISQTLVLLAALGALGACALAAARRPVAAALNSPELEPHLPAVGVLIVLSMLTWLLDSLMIIFKQTWLATATILASEVLRAAAMIGVATVTGSVAAVLLALVVWEGVRLLGLLVYLRRLGLSVRWRLSWARVRRQFAYALPFGLAIIVATAADSLHLYVVSHLYDPALFAIYSVGNLQIPLVGIAFLSVGEVTLVRLTELAREGQAGEAVALVGDAVAKVSLVLLPLYVWLLINAYDLIVLLFTPRFEASVGIFVVFLSMIPLIALGPDYVTRAYSDTGFFFRANVVRLVLSGALLIVLVGPLGPIGAALATVLAMAVMRVLMLLRIRTLLETTLGGLLPWARVGRIAGAAALAGALTWGVLAAWALEPLVRLVASAVLFSVIYGLLGWNLGVLTRGEKQRLSRLAHDVARPLGVVVSRALLLRRS